ncbi:DUF6602 domain-containing protein [Streptomyces sp. HUAS ZL42]|uniref:DUF6602 domain-containing protein n=1 Tax=Streptomyces sp. HUAS ZL42 TaxID=3231715 RepID=UPI00345E78FD
MSDPPPSALAKILASVADRMLADFKASGIAKHRGSKGTVREAQLLSTFLRKYLPRTVIAEHSGEVVATNGEVSGQCDILIMDPSTPPFWDEEDYRIVPVECLYGVIEVKSFLDREELRSACEKIARLKAFPKTAYHWDKVGQTRWVYGRSWHYVPTVGIIFAYDGANIDSLAEALRDISETRPPELRVDSVWVLNKGFVNWCCPHNDNVDVSPEPKAGLVAIEATPQEMLMPLVAHLNMHFVTAWMSALKITDYMPNETWGRVARAWPSPVAASGGEPTGNP